MENESADVTPSAEKGRGRIKPLSAPQRNFQYRRGPKRTGELSEAAFLLKATRMGLVVTKPWGDSERYDFIVDSGEQRSRVQIKCTGALLRRGYEVPSSYRVHGRMVRYTAEDVDFIVAHIVPLDVWYVVPIDTCCSTVLRLYPANCARARFEMCREAWHLLGCEKAAPGVTKSPAL